MANTKPIVRGRHMKTFLAIIDRQEASTRDRIRAGIPAATLQDIEASTTIGWLPVRINVEVTEIIARTLGKQGAHAFFRALLMAGFEGPVLGALVRSVIAIAGGSPAVGFKWVPKGFGIIFRDCGEWQTVESAEEHAVVEAKGLPPVMINSHLWLESVASSLTAVFSMVKATEGEVTIEDTDAGRGWVRFMARWR